jgi:hypothetical protein
MTKLLALVAAGVLSLGTGMFAHEGHAHTVMGTVSALVGATQLVVKTTDGKDVTITLNDKTTVTRGAGKLTLKDVAVGQRVVVNVGDGKTPLVARDIKMGVDSSGKIAVGGTKPRS